MRLFTALDIPESVRAALAEIVAPLQSLCRGARWVNLAGAHVTLKFLGEVPLEKLPDIRHALAQVRGEPFDLRFAGLAFFPDDRRPRVFWAGIEGGAPLAALAAAVEGALVPLGIAREERAYRPHLTLARFHSTEGIDRLREFPALRPLLRNGGEASFGATRITEFCLYQSILKPAGAEYTRLAAYSLSGESAS